MLGGDAGKFGTLSKAAFLAARAFALKGAAVGRAIAVRQRRHRRSFFHRTAKCCRQQFFRIRVARFLCEMRTGQNLHDFTLIKNDHALAEMTHKRQIMGNEEVRHAVLALQTTQKLYDERLHRYIEREVGSSQIRRDGRTETARAIATR